MHQANVIIKAVFRCMWIPGSTCTLISGYNDYVPPFIRLSEYPLITVWTEPGILVHRKAIIIIAFTHRALRHGAQRWQKCIIPLNCIARPSTRRRYPWPHLSLTFFRGSQLIPPKNPLFWGRVAVSLARAWHPCPAKRRRSQVGLAACCNRGSLCARHGHISWCGAVCSK